MVTKKELQQIKKRKKEIEKQIDLKHKQLNDYTIKIKKEIKQLSLEYEDEDGKEADYG